MCKKKNPHFTKEQEETILHFFTRIEQMNSVERMSERGRESKLEKEVLRQTPEVEKKS